MAEGSRPPQFKTPIGTVEEVEKLNMDPGEFYTCGPGNKELGILGCPKFKACQLRGGKAHDYDFKGEVIRGKSGPQYFGMQELANKSSGRRTINSIRPCYDIPRLAARSEASLHVKERGFIVRIIAREGEDIMINTRGPVDEDIPGQGKRRTYHPQPQKRTVPKFPRPGENPALGEDIFTATQAALFFESQPTESAAQFFGQVTTEAKPKEEEADGPAEGTKGRRATRG